MRSVLAACLIFWGIITVSYGVARFVTDVTVDPYKGLNYDVPNTYYMDEEDKPKKCSCFGCTWER